MNFAEDLPEPLGPTRATKSAANIRSGRHVRSSVIETLRIRHAELEFDEAPPCQVDGEKLEGKHFSIDLIPSALNVIFPD